MAYRSHTTKETNGFTTITINKPSGVVDGDILVLLVSLDRTTSETITPPSGFTALASSPLNSTVESGSAACFWKKAGASEPASYDWTCTSSGQTVGILVAYSGRDGTTPINASSGLAEGSAASAASVNATGITPSVDNCDIVYLAATDTTISATVSWTPPSGMTERAEISSSTPWVNATLADLTQGSAAATGTVTGTASWTGGGNTGRMAFLLALAPSAGVAVNGSSTATLAGTSGSASGYLAQVAIPTSDGAAGSWQSTGANMFSTLDEFPANDSDYIFTFTKNSPARIKLGALSDPNVSTGHKVFYRLKGDGSATMRVRLYSGGSSTAGSGTLIKTWTHTPAPGSLTDYEQTLSGAEADSITDYANLYLEFEAQ